MFLRCFLTLAKVQPHVFFKNISYKKNVYSYSIQPDIVRDIFYVIVYQKLQSVNSARHYLPEKNTPTPK